VVEVHRIFRQLLLSVWTYVIGGLLTFYALMYVFLDLPASLTDRAVVDPLRTLLGGLATGLITAQALVFTISLVAAQLNARYTHRTASRVFTWPTALYMGLFIGSSIYAMVVLAALSSGSSEFVVQVLNLPPVHPVIIALALAGTCLVLLVPYLWSFKRRLDPERMVQDEGQRARKRLQWSGRTEPPEVAALDNIVMSAFGYKDYDTFGSGLQELAQVSVEAWRLPRGEMGTSMFHRLANIGVATVDDPRAPYRVIDALTEAGKALVDQGVQEGARQAAVALSALGEAGVDKGRVAVTAQAAFALSALGIQATDRRLVAAAEEAAYSLGYLGGKAATRGLEEPIRQVATSLRRVGENAAVHRLDLPARQAMISLWLLGARTTHHLPQCAQVVALELAMMERVGDVELVDASYLSTPRSQDLENFRLFYLKDVRKAEGSVLVDRGVG
jgi:hypothetical protein